MRRDMQNKQNENEKLNVWKQIFVCVLFFFSLFVGLD